MTARRAAAFVALAACSWGCWSLFVRPSGLSSRETAPILFAVMGLGLLPFGWLDGPRPAWSRQLAALMALCAVLDAVNVLTFFAALGVTSIGVAVLAHYMAPILVAMAAPLVDGERVPGALVAGAAGTIGLALVLEPWRAAPEGLWLGAALGAVSAVAYAGNVFVLRRLSRSVGPVRTIGWHSLVALAIVVPFADFGALARADGGRMAWYVAGCVVAGAMAGILFVRGLAVIGPTRAAMLAFLEPLVALVVGWLAWHESLRPPAIAGAAMILGASAWAALAPREGGGGSG